MNWHEITLLISLLLYYYYIHVGFLLYFENKEKFCSFVLLQICSTFFNIIYFSFVGFFDLILSNFIRVLLTGGRYGASPTTTSQNVAPPTTTKKQLPPPPSSHAHAHAHTHTHTHTHTLTINNNFKVITQ